MKSAYDEILKDIFEKPIFCKCDSMAEVCGDPAKLVGRPMTTGGPLVASSTGGLARTFYKIALIEGNLAVLWCELKLHTDEVKK
mgnify:CR=1 FL=1